MIGRTTKQRTGESKMKRAMFAVAAMALAPDGQHLRIRAQRQGHAHALGHRRGQPRCGGDGAIKEYRVERLMRDAKSARPGKGRNRCTSTTRKRRAQVLFLAFCLLETGDA